MRPKVALWMARDRSVSSPGAGRPAERFKCQCAAPATGDQRGDAIDRGGERLQCGIFVPYELVIPRLNPPGFMPKKGSKTKRRSAAGRKRASKRRMSEKKKKQLQALIPRWRSIRMAIMLQADQLDTGLCPSYLIEPLAPHWGETVAFIAFPGETFGTRPPGGVWLLAGVDPFNPDAKVQLAPDLWDLIRVEVTLPANPIAEGPPYWVQLPSEACEPRPISIFLPNGNLVDCPLFQVDPLVAFWGDNVALRTALSPSGFGTTPGTVQLTGIGVGGRRLPAEIQSLAPTRTRSQALQIVSWGEAEIIARLPASAPFFGPYGIKVRRNGSNTDCSPVGDTPLAITTIPPLVRFLTLIKLVCCKTEDHTGDDEVRLDVSVIGGGPSVFTDNRRAMNNGDEWQLGWSSYVPLTATLWDEDVNLFGVVDKHDKLGSADFKLEAIEDTRVRFCDDGADYYLYYRVEAVQRPPGVVGILA